jgi:hypothetical protein
VGSEAMFVHPLYFTSWVILHTKQTGGMKMTSPPASSAARPGAELGVLPAERLHPLRRHLPWGTSLQQPVRTLNSPGYPTLPQ